MQVWEAGRGRRGEGEGGGEVKGGGEGEGRRRGGRRGRGVGIEEGGAMRRRGVNRHDFLGGREGAWRQIDGEWEIGRG